jgi:hypothetical protein
MNEESDNLTMKRNDDKERLLVIKKISNVRFCTYDKTLINSLINGPSSNDRQNNIHEEV